MTRGRRNNPITIPSPGAKPAQPTVARAISDEMFVELHRRGLITSSQLKAAKQLLRDKAANGKGQLKETIARIPPQHMQPLEEIVLNGMALKDFGNKLTGKRNDSYCREFALDLLRFALTALDRVYLGHTDGRKFTTSFTGYGG